MDFARKQLEKWGWSQGSGLGKSGNTGISAAIKPSYKTGKEGLGFDLSKDLVDTWWTRAYSDSLKRVKVSDTPENLGENNGTNEVIVSVDNEDDSSSTNEMTKMRRRMCKSNFTDFSKGATLTNGELVDETQDTSSTDSGISTPTSSKELKLTDEELFKACGGRTAHKAARFGHKLSGKLARLAAQEAEEIRNLNLASNEPKQSDSEICDIAIIDLPIEKKKKKRRKEDFVNVDDEVEILCKKSRKSKIVEEPEPEVQIETETLPSANRKKKSKKNNRPNDLEEETDSITEVQTRNPKKSKKKRKHNESDSELIN